MLSVRGWSPYGSPPSTKISREEAEWFDERIRDALGVEYEKPDLMLPFVANRQVGCRFRGSDVCDFKRIMAWRAPSRPAMSESMTESYEWCWNRVRRSTGCDERARAGQG